MDLRARLAEIVAKHGSVEERPPEFEELVLPNESELRLVQKAKAMHLMFLFEGNKTPGKFIVTIDLRKESWHLDVSPQMEKIKISSRKAATKLNLSSTGFSTRGNHRHSNNCSSQKRSNSNERLGGGSCRLDQNCEPLVSGVKNCDVDCGKKRARGVDNIKSKKKIRVDGGGVAASAASYFNGNLEQRCLFGYHKQPGVWDKLDLVGETEYEVRLTDLIYMEW